MATPNVGYFDAFREIPYPAIYEPNKTAVTVDVLIAGLIYAFVIIAISFIVIIPGTRLREHLKWSIQISFSLFVLVSIFLCNFGYDWEVASQKNVVVQYKSGVKEEVEADVGLYIGLRGANITLKGHNESMLEKRGEKIDYNERFTWGEESWSQGRIGFGPFAFSFNRQFRAAQIKGLPYPILWIAEYFTIDGEGIRWGRFYKQAGFYTHIMIWLAFPLWILTNILFTMVVRYGAYFLFLTGSSLLTGNLLFATIRNPIPLKIPFASHTAQKNLELKYGWCFWLCLLAGLICVFVSIVIAILDLRAPTFISSFFGVDEQLFENEDYVGGAGAENAGFQTENREPGDIEMQRTRTAPSGAALAVPPPAPASSNGFDRGKAPVPPTRPDISKQAAADNSDEDDDDLPTYFNVSRPVPPRPKGIVSKFQKSRRGTRRRPPPEPIIESEDEDYYNEREAEPLRRREKPPPQQKQRAVAPPRPDPRAGSNLPPRPPAR